MTLLLLCSSHHILQTNYNMGPDITQPWTLESFSALTSLTELRISLNKWWENRGGEAIELAETLIGL